MVTKKRYLYGVSVKGIQGYIFASNELKEIIGASEIIKSIENMVKIGTKGSSPIKIKYELDSTPKVLLSAAGNIRLIIDNEADAKKLVLDFIKDIKQMAYGITVVQALVEMKDDSADSIRKCRPRLEKDLNIQRNKAALPLDMGFTILEMDAKSGRSVHSKKIKGIGDDAYRNMSTYQKIKAYSDMPDEKKKNVEFSEISNENNKIAIIHADGNGLGNFVKNYTGDISEFSKALDGATHAAFEDAKGSFADIRDREVILSGDDMTMICNADYALGFTQKYLQNFEKKTKEIDGANDGLTACAGIVYCHEKLPFHYAVALAEELCDYSKQHAKQIDPDLAPSCLMFYNSKESGLVDYKETIEKTKNLTKVSFDFGPYYINDIKHNGKKQPTVEAFVSLYNMIDEESGMMAKYRKASSELYHDKIVFDRMLSDMGMKFSYGDKIKLDGKWSELYEGLKSDKLTVDKDGISKTPLIDILELKNVLEEES